MSEPLKNLSSLLAENETLATENTRLKAEIDSLKAGQTDFNRKVAGEVVRLGVARNVGAVVGADGHQPGGGSGLTVTEICMRERGIQFTPGEAHHVIRRN